MIVNNVRKSHWQWSYGQKKLMEAAGARFDENDNFINDDTDRPHISKARDFQTTTNRDIPDSQKKST